MMPIPYLLSLEEPEVVMMDILSSQAAPKVAIVRAFMMPTLGLLAAPEFVVTSYFITNLV